MMKRHWIIFQLLIEIKLPNYIFCLYYIKCVLENLFTFTVAKNNKTFELHRSDASPVVSRPKNEKTKEGKPYYNFLLKIFSQ